MKMKKFEKLIKQERDQRSIEVFGKIESELSIGQKFMLDKYIQDYHNPIWKQIIWNNIPTHYDVSNIGQIKNTKTGFILKPFESGKGNYLQIVITINDVIKQKYLLVHRLVANAFIPNPENKPQVNHISGIKTCNWVGNLEWNTCKENIDHAFRTGLRKIKYGEEANSNKYSLKQIQQVCKLLEENKLSQVKIAQITGVKVDTVSDIKTRGSWIEVSSKYKIPLPIRNPIGSLNKSSKYKEKDIHEVCKLLMNPKNSMMYISRVTNVGYDMIYRIKKGINWKHISSQYNLPSQIN